MNKDEILEVLSQLGIIVSIGEEYFVSEKYKELISLQQEITLKKVQEAERKPIDYDKILNKKLANTTWPTAVIEATGRLKIIALMDACSIPHTGGKGYRLRSVTDEMSNIISNIVVDDAINPLVFMEAVRLYYQNTEMPKTFKNLVCDGDVLDLYQEHLMGTLVQSFNPESKPSNTQWG